QIVRGAGGREPSRAGIGIALVGPVLGPRIGQGMVVRRDVVAEQVLVGLVEIDALRDERLVVAVEWNAGGIIGVWGTHGAGLDFEHVILAVAVLIDPFSDGIARERRLD